VCDVPSNSTSWSYAGSADTPLAVDPQAVAAWAQQSVAPYFADVSGGRYRTSFVALGRIALAPADDTKREVPDPAAPAAAKQGGTSPTPRAVTGSTPTTAKPKKATGATLNLTSTPASTIVLDGRPLGRTPQNGVSVTAGKHTVVFVNPQRGRKTVKVQVSAGGNKNVSVRF
jgi:hypothetical protein